MAINNNTELGSEKKIWDAACILRSNMDEAEYKHVILGLIFLKYISDRFAKRYNDLLTEGQGFEEDVDEFNAENVFFVPAAARWSVVAGHGLDANPTTWKLCRMNLAIRGIEADLEKPADDTFYNDLHPTMKADFILANPTFNLSDWGMDKLSEDVRWKYGFPPSGATPTLLGCSTGFTI